MGDNDDDEDNDNVSDDDGNGATGDWIPRRWRQRWRWMTTTHNHKDPPKVLPIIVIHKHMMVIVAGGEQVPGLNATGTNLLRCT